MAFGVLRGQPIPTLRGNAAIASGGTVGSGKVTLQAGTHSGDARPRDPGAGDGPARNRLLRRGSSSSWTKAGGRRRR